MTALLEKPMKIFEVMKRTNMTIQEACQSLLLKMRDEGAIKFNINKGIWSIKLDLDALGGETVHCRAMLG